MTARRIEGLDEWRREVEAKRRQFEEYAAARIMPGVSSLSAFFDELERLTKTDPARARSIYLRWRHEIGEAVYLPPEAPPLRVYDQALPIWQCSRCGSERFMVPVAFDAATGRMRLWGQTMECPGCHATYPIPELKGVS